MTKKTTDHAVMLYLPADFYKQVKQIAARVNVPTGTFLREILEYSSNELSSIYENILELRKQRLLEVAIATDITLPDDVREQAVPGFSAKRPDGSVKSRGQALREAAKLNEVRLSAKELKALRK